MGSLKKQIKRLVQKESFAYRCLLFLYRIFSQCTKFIHDNLVYCFIIKGIIRDIQQNLDANKHLSSEGGRLASSDDQDVIWVCWFQGMEQAPELVQTCFSRLCAVEKHRVILITEENMLQYADIPSSILKKWKAGNIPNPNFSDILRTVLLYQHGGLWIDATMLLVKPVPQYIWESPLFVFQYTENPLIFDAFSSHFMRGHAGDEFLGRVLYGMLRYWEKYDTLKDYFIYHFIFTGVARMDDDMRRIYANIPLRLSESNHLLQRYWLRQYDADMWDWLISRSFIHKLTYKGLTGVDLNNTYYDYIVKTYNQKKGFDYYDTEQE